MKPAVYYRMEEWPKSDEKDSYVLVDSAPGGHHGVLHHDDAFGPPFCRGRFGHALDQRLMVGDYATVPDYPKTQTNQLSVSAWVWATTLDSNATIAQNFWASGSGLTKVGQFWFGVSNELELMVYLGLSGGRGAFVREGSRTALPRTAWQHVTFVADGSTLRLYRNGVEVGSSPCSGLIIQTPTFAVLGIGCQTGETGTTRDPPIYIWNGRLDEIAVFNHALSPAAGAPALLGTARRHESQRARNPERKERRRQ